VPGQPVFHCLTEEPNFDPALRDVSLRFAQAAANCSARGATVWIHDYHLQLGSAMLRSLRPELRIGFFLDAPFPPVDVFRRLPGREETLSGLLGADLIGFQTALSADNFARSVSSLIGLHATSNRTRCG
jgi:trehalose 6-phosphate synthase